MILHRTGLPLRSLLDFLSQLNFVFYLIKPYEHRKYCSTHYTVFFQCKRFRYVNEQKYLLYTWQYCQVYLT